MKSSPIVELCVGTIERPARYRWAGLSTSTQRTGTDSTRRTSVIVTGLVSGRPTGGQCRFEAVGPGSQGRGGDDAATGRHWCDASATIVVPSDRSIS